MKPTLEQLPALFSEFMEDFRKFMEEMKQGKRVDIEAPIGVEEAMKFIGLENTQTIYRMVRANRIPHYKKNSRLYFFKYELEKWIKESK